MGDLRSLTASSLQVPPPVTERSQVSRKQHRQQPHKTLLDKRWGGHHPPPQREELRPRPPPLGPRSRRLRSRRHPIPHRCERRGRTRQVSAPAEPVSSGKTNRQRRGEISPAQPGASGQPRAAAGVGRGAPGEGRVARDPRAALGKRRQRSGGAGRGPRDTNTLPARGPALHSTLGRASSNGDGRARTGPAARGLAQS